MSTPNVWSQPAQLVALEDSIQPAWLLLENEVYMLGRADICQMIIPPKQVSRLHAVIEREQPAAYILRDTHSANGTYVNGRRIRDDYLLQDQDEIGLGTATPHLRFELSPSK